MLTGGNFVFFICLGPLEDSQSTNQTILEVFFIFTDYSNRRISHNAHIAGEIGVQLFFEINLSVESHLSDQDRRKICQVRNPIHAVVFLWDRTEVWHRTGFKDLICEIFIHVHKVAQRLPHEFVWR